MDITSLYYFSEVAKDLHITKTAKRLYISQQTLSNHIQRLEEQSAPVSAVVATGRSAPEVLKYCKREILYDTDLLLRGLHLIYRKNTEGKGRRA